MSRPPRSSLPKAGEGAEPSGHSGNGPTGPPPVDRLTLRLDELARALGVSRRALERERSAGRFPKPDLHVGKMPLWAPSTVRRWVEGGGRA